MNTCLYGRDDEKSLDPDEASEFWERVLGEEEAHKMDLLFLKCFADAALDIWRKVERQL